MWGAGSHNGSDFLPAGDGCAQIDFVFSLPHSVKGPELINMYVGQSEENVRNGEDVHPAPAPGEMGLFWRAAGKEVVLKPPSQLPPTVLSKDWNPAISYRPFPAPCSFPLPLSLLCCSCPWCS